MKGEKNERGDLPGKRQSRKADSGRGRPVPSVKCSPLMQTQWHGHLHSGRRTCARKLLTDSRGFAQNKRFCSFHKERLSLVRCLRVARNEHLPSLVERPRDPQSPQPRVRERPHATARSVLRDLELRGADSRFLRHDTKVNGGRPIVRPASENSQGQRQGAERGCLENGRRGKQLRGRACVCCLRTEDLEETLQRISNGICAVSFRPSP